MSERVTATMKNEQDICKAKVRAVLALMRKEYKIAVYSRIIEVWVAFDHVPESEYEMFSEFFCYGLPGFDLPPFPGDWKDSLVER